MGQVSRTLIAIGLIPLVPAIVLTIASVVFPAFFPDIVWINVIVKAFIGFLFVIAFAFMILGIIIMKRDKE